MNYFKRYSRDLSVQMFFLAFLPGAIALGSYAAMQAYLHLNTIQTAAISGSLFIILTLYTHGVITRLALEPIEKLWQAVWHISPGSQPVAAPNIDSLKHGRELISSLVLQIYDFASSSPRALTKTENSETTGSASLPSGKSILEQLPLPIIILNKDRTVKVANQQAIQYVELPKEKVLGQNVNDVLRMSFMTDDTFEKWLDDASANKATDSKSWEHVRLQADEHLKQFDLAVSFSKDNPDGNEIILLLMDHTETYKHQDQAYSYVALAVHELRTPLTVLRGYIEVFDDELGGQLSPELREFMRKMNAASQSLTAFVSNILNVARVEENQLVLSLHEENWNSVLPEILSDLELRASVRGKVIELDIEDNLPNVAIDKISMYEVVSNLIDNAVKYSGQAPKIVVHARASKDGTIETIVQDFGIGIPENAIDGLFSKFYRSSRSKNSISGSGLGLYLVKAIVTAHGGNVWVNSKEGEGSSFGFSLQPYASFAQTNEAKSPEGITRSANGWIKNHSLYRR